VVAPDLVAVVELDPSEDEREALVGLEPREQRRAALLEELVVDGLVEVAEHVEVAPADGDGHPGLEHGHRACLPSQASIRRRAMASGGGTSTSPRPATGGLELGA
jgi:hypothetical protein